ncbi:MAG: class I SAM-dependent methyltransferase [Methylocella sp.]
MRIMKNILDFIFDKRHGTDTADIVRLEDLTIESKKKRLGNFYVATPVYEFRKIIRHLGIDTTKYTFVDFGCGKGRVLLYAIDYKFLNIIGIEFSNQLAKIAADNIAKVDKENRCHPKIIVGDAAEFIIPREPCVLFFFNPFSDIVTSEVLSNIYNAYRANNLDIYVVWYNVTPCAAPLFEAPWLKILVGEQTCNTLWDERSLLQTAEISLPYSIFKVSQIRAG